MKITIFGSSLVYYLSQFDKTWKHTLKGGQEIELTYYGYSGWSFHDFLSKGGLEELEDISAESPDIVLAILGANSIKLNVDPGVIMYEASKFYRTLNEKFLSVNPNGIIIASQLPLRFVRNPKKNKHKTPDPKLFKRIRDKVNTKIVSLKTKHHTLALGGPGRLDDEGWFSDGVHFNSEGMDKQLDIILEKIDKIVNPPLMVPKSFKVNK